MLSETLLAALDSASAYEGARGKRNRETMSGWVVRMWEKNEFG